MITPDIQHGIASICIMIVAGFLIVRFPILMMVESVISAKYNLVERIALFLCGLIVAGAIGYGAWRLV